MKLLYPWIELKSPEMFEAQFAKEVLPGHVLYGTPAKAIARMDGCDEFLFALVDGTDRVAVVHLAFAASTSPEWPFTEMFSNQTEWESKRMQADSYGVT
jgi:hypothetical protein